MDDHFEQIRDQQRNTWNKFSPGWRKWDQFTMDFLRPWGDEIVEMIRPNGAEVILDVAAGTGEPGLTIATKLNGGKVVVTDLAEGMLDVARDNAARRGISNLETIACDVSEMPFDDNSFDAISCRFGFMFFPDMLLAAKEMRRVLKPGGRMAVAVWGLPAKNVWITATMGSLVKHMDLPTPPADAPGIFRCAADGMMTQLLNDAGFRDIRERELSGFLNADNAHVYWSFMTEVVAPVVAAMSAADDAMKARIHDDVLQRVHDEYGTSNIDIHASATVVYAEK